MENSEYPISRRRPKAWKVLLFLAIGTLVRAAPVARSSYPLGEGGLFSYIIQFVAANGKLPTEIPYYSCGIPFAYPPLGFVTYGFLLRWSTLSLFTLLKWGPVLLSVLSMGAFALLAYELLEEGLAAEIAILSFATMPAIALRVTASDAIRNLAVIFYLLALFSLHRALTKQNSTLWALAAGTFTGLTVLTHPTTTLSLLTVACLFAVYYSILRRSRRLTSLVGISLGVSAFLALPWLLWLYHHHGVASVGMMANAFSSRPHKSIWFLTLLRLGNTGEPFGQLWAVLGTIGMLYSLVAGAPLLVLWFLISPVHWFRPAYGIPLAIAAGLGTANVVAPNLRPRRRLHRRWTDALHLGLLIIYTTGSALTFSVTPDVPIIGKVFGDKGMQSQVTVARLAAWNWMADHLPPFSQVVIVGEEKEWVPGLAHVCASIPQGAEWKGQFLNNGQMYNELKGISDYAGLIDILERYNQPIGYLYVSTKPSPQFVESMARSGGVVHTLLREMDNTKCAIKVFENEEVTLYDLRGCKGPEA